VSGWPSRSDIDGPVRLPDPTQQPTVGVDEAAALLSCSTWAAYEAIRRGDFPVPVLKVGRKIRIPTMPLLRQLGLAEPAA
jgi:hypothetical protein